MIGAMYSVSHLRSSSGSAFNRSDLGAAGIFLAATGAACASFASGGGGAGVCVFSSVIVFALGSETEARRSQRAFKPSVETFGAAPRAMTSADPRPEISLAIRARAHAQLPEFRLAAQTRSKLVLPPRVSKIPMSPGSQSLLGPPKLGR